MISVFGMCCQMFAMSTSNKTRDIRLSFVIMKFIFS